MNIDLDEIVSKIRERGAKIVGIQLPSGLKRKSTEIASEIESRTGASVIISGDSCYGPCDVDEKLEECVDLLFHFGHSGENYGKRIFIEVRSDVEVGDVVKKAIGFLRGEKIGILSTVQHVHKLEEVKKILLEWGKEGVIEKGNLKYPGQVLGCDFSSAGKCDEFLFIGSGMFHPIGISFYTGKRVIAADPFLCDVKEIDPNVVRRKRYAVISKAMDAKSFGIIVGKKGGQFKMEVARRLMEISKNVFDVHLFMMDEITPEKLMEFGVDAWVNTACPRISEDFFEKPMLNPEEFEELVRHVCDRNRESCKGI
ncbi:MAG: diphthamide biosynthesis enzyme Dph2 [Candidatus Syntropharchaeia archaeon]